MRLIRELFAKYGIELRTTQLGDSSRRGAKLMTDGDSTLLDKMLVILEGKRASGSGGGADALFEGSLYKISHLLSDSYSQRPSTLVDSYAEPCFLVTIIGGYSDTAWLVFSC